MGASIDTNGIITWIPDETQGPGTNSITTVVTDNGTPPRSVTNSSTVVVNEFDACLSQNCFHQLERPWVARVTSDFNIVDGVSMKTCCFREVPNRPIKSSSSHSYLCTCHSHNIVLLSHVAESQVRLAHVGGSTYELRKQFTAKAYEL